MRIGLITRSDLSGLGMQTRELYKLLNPDKVLLIDSTPLNGREQNPEWYKDPIISVGYPYDNMVESFLQDLDVVISCEVPYNNNLYRIARERGVKTILQPNAELNPHFTNRRLDKPDYFFLPSCWYEEQYKHLRIPYRIIKPPIIEPRKELNIKKQVGELKVLHFGGRRAAHDRNGTEIVKSLPKIEGVEIDNHDQSENEVVDQREIYERGYHIVLIPRRYGGLCLPMLESLSYAIPVVMPKIPPNTIELPHEWLTSVLKPRHVMGKRPIISYDSNPNNIVEHLKRWRDMDQEAYNLERIKAKDRYKAHQDQLSLWELTLEELCS